MITWVMICALAQIMTSFGPSSPQASTLALTGDIMMGTTFPTLQLPVEDGKFLFTDTSPFLKRADVALGNLEGTLCDEGETKKEISKINYAFRTPTTFSSRLQEAGFDFMSMANNHSFDFGIEGVRSTMHSLDSLQIKHAGIRGGIEKTILIRNDIKYGICAFGHNSHTLRHQDLKTVGRIISDLVKNTDIVIVSFHGGAEGNSKNRLPYETEIFLEEDRGNLRQFAHYCIDAGADVVFGHGPHVLRAVELYKGRFIAYSLGNFCTPYGINITGIAGYAPILELKIAKDGNFLKGKIHSFIQVKGRGPRTDNEHHAAREIRRLTNLDVPDTPLIITDNGSIFRI